MYRVTAVPSLAFILAGSMDCLTTIVGILFFGAVESNPFLANITNTNLTVFTIIKLATVLLVGLVFHQAEKILAKTQEKNTVTYKRTHYILKSAYVAATAFLLLAVLNNLIIIIKVI